MSIKASNSVNTIAIYSSEKSKIQAIPLNMEFGIDRKVLKEIMKEILLEIEEEKKPKQKLSVKEILKLYEAHQSCTIVTKIPKDTPATTSVAKMDDTIQSTYTTSQN
jgi:hypothetical protein